MSNRELGGTVANSEEASNPIVTVRHLLVLSLVFAAQRPLETAEHRPMGGGGECLEGQWPKGKCLVLDTRDMSDM